MRGRAIAAILAGLLVAFDGEPAWVASVPAVSVGVDRHASLPRRSWEHRYRVSGKIRLLAFWVGRDAVGGARMSRRIDASGRSTLSFLAGSDPARAPRNLNRWGYFLEDDLGRSFVVRTLDGVGVESAESRLADGTGNVLIGAGCSSIRGDDDRASVTGVRADEDLTFRRFDQMLSALDASSRWEQRRAANGQGAYPGFFTALQAAIDESVAGSPAGAIEPSVRRRPYMFTGTIFELVVRRVEYAGSGQLRGVYAFQPLGSGEGQEFAVVFGTAADRVGVPLAMTFMPHWWLKVELRLDDEADVPPDPSRDPLTVRRIDELCARTLSEAAAQN